MISTQNFVQKNDRKTDESLNMPPYFVNLLENLANFSTANSSNINIIFFHMSNNNLEINQ